MSNKNNFFCVTLSPEWRQHLGDLAQAISDEGNGGESESEGAEGYTFAPMAHEDIHMTFCFCGEYFQHMKRDKLIQMRDQLCRKDPPQPFDLVLKGIELFPPEKQNLVVALFESNAYQQRRHQEVVQVIASSVGGAGGSDITTRNSSGPWVPHVTLGKIGGGKCDDVLRGAKKVLDRVGM
eukprot:PhF_6_TR6852/c0_g1_i1/m.9865